MKNKQEQLRQWLWYHDRETHHHNNNHISLSWVPALGLILLQALPTLTVKVLLLYYGYTHSHTHRHVKWKSKAIPPRIKLCGWSNGLSWWQGTIISSKEVRAAAWRMKNIAKSGGMGNTKTDCKTPRDLLQFSIYNKLMSLSFFLPTFSVCPCYKKRKQLTWRSQQSNDLSIITRPVATTQSTRETVGRWRKGGSEGGRQKSNGNNQCL